MKTVMCPPFAVLTILLGIAKTGSSILCYDCNSAFDPRCGDEFDPFSLGIVNCSLRDPLDHLPDLEPTVCRSIRMEISGKIRTVRQCGYLRDEKTDDKPCYRRTNTDQLFITYCSCTTDLCNGSYTLQMRYEALLLLLLALCINVGW